LDFVERSPIQQQPNQREEHCCLWFFCVDGMDLSICVCIVRIVLGVWIDITNASNLRCVVLTIILFHTFIILSFFLLVRERGDSGVTYSIYGRILYSTLLPQGSVYKIQADMASLSKGATCFLLQERLPCFHTRNQCSPLSSASTSSS
jgi:hypothetical protein